MIEAVFGGRILWGTAKFDLETNDDAYLHFALEDQHFMGGRLCFPKYSA